MDANRRDVARALGAWLDTGRPVVLATVVASSGSAPRGLGAQLAIAGEEEWVGALSGGCTEAAVIDEALRLIRDGSDADAALVTYEKRTLADVGPVCGSTLSVLVERVDEELLEALEAQIDDARAGHASMMTRRWKVRDGDAVAALPRDGETLLLQRRFVRELVAPKLDVADSSHELQFDTQILTLDETIPAPIHLVIGGGGDIARELLHQARRLGWRTTLIDPRSAIAQQTLSHASADQHLAGWPNDVWESVGIDERAACIACAHEVHLDEPFLARALASQAMYIGAVGSRKVQHERRGALASLVDDTHLARLRGPAGIDLGGHAAAEIALAIAAEILAVSNKREGAPLSSITGPIRAT